MTSRRLERLRLRGRRRESHYVGVADALDDIERVSLAEVQSTDPYVSLGLDANSPSSPLRHHPRKPGGLGRGMPVEAFERIYGPIT